MNRPSEIQNPQPLKALANSRLSGVGIRVPKRKNDKSNMEHKNQNDNDELGWYFQKKNSQI